MTSPSTQWANSGEVEALSDRLDYFVSLFSSVASWVAIGSAILGIFIAVVFSVATFFGWSELRRVRASYRSLDRLFEKNQEITENLQNLIIRNEESISLRLQEIEKELEQFKHNLTDKIDIRIRFIQEAISGELCYRVSDYPGALRHYKAAMEIDGEDSDVRYNLARTLTYINDIPGAIRLFEDLIQSDPENVNPRRGYALAIRFTKPRQALDLLDGALEIPGISSVMASKLENEKGLIYRDLREFDQCLASHRLAIARNPKDTVTRYFLGIAELSCGLVKEGHRHIDLAAASVKDEIATHDLKPLWGDVIEWSALFLSDQPEADAKWDTVQRHLTTKYVSETVLAHVSCIASATDRKVPVRTIP